jgi:hypothetical protein
MEVESEQHAGHFKESTLTGLPKEGEQIVDAQLTDIPSRSASPRSKPTLDASVCSFDWDTKTPARLQDGKFADKVLEKRIKNQHDAIQRFLVSTWVAGGRSRTKAKQRLKELKASTHTAGSRGETFAQFLRGIAEEQVRDGMTPRRATYPGAPAGDQQQDEITLNNLSEIC